MIHITKTLTYDQINEIRKFDNEGIVDYVSDPFTFHVALITDDQSNEILAMGIIRVINEFKLAIKPELSNLEKAKIIKSLMNKAIGLRDCNEVIVIITKGGWSYKELLKKHFKFDEIDGFPMKKEV